MPNPTEDHGDFPKAFSGAVQRNLYAHRQESAHQTNMWLQAGVTLLPFAGELQSLVVWLISGSCALGCRQTNTKRSITFISVFIFIFYTLFLLFDLTSPIKNIYFCLKCHIKADYIQILLNCTRISSEDEAWLIPHWNPHVTAALRLKGRGEQINQITKKQIRHFWRAHLGFV